MRPIGKSSFLMSLGAASALLAFSPVQAATFNCQTSSTARIATVMPAQSTLSTEFVDVSGASFDISLAASGCIQVEVTFQASTIDPYAGQLRVLVDDVPIGPTSVAFHTSASRLDNRTATFVKATNTGGDHTIKLQFASTEGFAVTISKVVVIVRYTTGFI
jgi:hypothetical protein